MFKKLMSMLLVVTIFVSALPAEAFAFTSALLQNDSVANTILLDELKSYYGDDAEGYLETLEELGFLDEDGNLKPDEAIVVDGKEMTLTEIEEMVNAPDTDLETVVTVDGYPLTLNDLKLMIEIEKEVARIYSTYYTEQDWTPEQIAMLENLNEQAGEGNLELPEDFSVQEDVVVEPELNTISNADAIKDLPAESWDELGVKAHEAVVSISTSNSFNVTIGNIQQVYVPVTVTGAQPNSKVTGLYSTVDGTAKGYTAITDGVNYVSVENRPFEIQTDNTGYGTTNVYFTVRISANYVENVNFLVQLHDIVGASNTRAAGIVNLRCDDVINAEELQFEYRFGGEEVVTRTITESGYKNDNSVETSTVAKALIGMGVFSGFKVTPFLQNMSGHNPVYHTNTLSGGGGNYADKTPEISYSNSALYASFDQNLSYEYTSGNINAYNSYSPFGAFNAIDYHLKGADDKDLFRVRNAYGVYMDIKLQSGSSEEVIHSENRGFARTGTVVHEMLYDAEKSSNTLTKSLDFISYPNYDKTNYTVNDGNIVEIEESGNSYYKFSWQGENGEGNIDQSMAAIYDMMMDSNIAFAKYDINSSNNSYATKGFFTDSDTDYGVSKLNDTYRNDLSDIDFSDPYYVDLTEDELEALRLGTEIIVEPKLSQARLVWLRDEGVTSDSFADVYLTMPAANEWPYYSGTASDTYVQVELTDTKKPTIVKAEVMRLPDIDNPNDNYYDAGDLVPVKVTFSEPVTFGQSPVVSIKKDGVEINHQSLPAAYYDEYKIEHVFYFRIDENAPGYFNEISISSDVRDLYDNTLDNKTKAISKAGSTDNNNVDEEPYTNVVSYNNSIVSVSPTPILSEGVVGGAIVPDKVQIDVVVGENDYQKLIASSVDTSTGVPIATTIAAQATYKDIDGNVKTSDAIPLEFTDITTVNGAEHLGSKLSGVAELADISATDRAVLVEVIELRAAPGTNRVIPRAYAKSAIPPHVYVELDDVSLVLPMEDASNPDGFMKEHKETVVGSSDTITRYTFSFDDIIGADAKDAHIMIDLADLANANYTFPNSFEITSSDEDVLKAELDATTDRKINLIAGKAGIATISVKPNNAGLHIPTGDAIEVTFEVLQGSHPFLATQGGHDKIESYLGTPFSVNFLSNLSENTVEGTPINLTLKIFDSANEQVYTDTIVYEFESEDIKTNFAVAGDVLTQTGDYTATLETDYANISALDYEITIIPNPVIAALSDLTNNYITDETDEVALTWSLENWDGAQGLFSLTITDENGTVVHSDTVAPTQNFGTYNFTIKNVEPTQGDYRDIYTISLKAQNTTDPTISQDSIVLYVYPQDIVELYIVDEEGDIIDKGDDVNYTLSNRDDMASKTQTQILALERNIQLEAYLHSNYTDYNFGQVSDQFEWSVASDEEKAEVAALYKYQNSAYYDLRSLVNAAYMPDEHMLVAGLNDGEATITAEHANTGDSAEVNLTVETLEDHLYLIDAYPNAQVNYEYVNGDGETKTGKSNDEGKIAIYDETGIASDVYLEADVNGEKYFGTIANKDLKSREENSAYNVLYPENLIELRRAAYADIYLKNADDGEDFTGNVTVRAGVYVNGEYVKEAYFSFDGSLPTLKGYEDMTVTPKGNDEGGHIGITMDITQFVADHNDAIKVNDDVKYIFEIYADGKYPIIIEEDPNVNIEHIESTGDFIYFLEDAPTEEAFIGYSSTGYYDNQVELPLHKDIHYVGPSENYLAVHLNTDIYWWGAQYADLDDTKAYVNIVDETGRAMVNQEVKTVKHEFSDMYRTENITPFDQEQMSNMNLAQKDARVIKAEIAKEKGEVYKSITFEQKIINLLGVVKVQEDEDLTKNLDTIADLRVDGGFESDVQEHESAFVDGFSMLTKVLSFGMGEPVEILFEPTADPLVYTAIISKNANQSDVGYDESRQDHTVTLNILDPSTNKDKTTPNRRAKKKMLNGESAKALQEDVGKLNDVLAGGSASGGRFTFVPPSLGGYIEAEFKYNPQDDTWNMELVSGGLSADTGFGYRYSWNTLLGGLVPVTATLEMGVGLGIAADFQSGEYYARDEFIQVGPTSDEYILPEPEKGIDILTELRLSAYFEVFGGLGFDLSVVAAKIGVFGRMDVIAGFRWLNRPYLSDDTFDDDYYIPPVMDVDGTTNVAYKEVLNAQDLLIKGKVGLRAELKFLFIEKTYEFFSVEFEIFNDTWGQWNQISDIWLRNDRVNGNPINQVTIGGAELFSIDYGNVVESRTYLDAEPRSYNVQGDEQWETRYYQELMERSYDPIVLTDTYALDEGSDSKFLTKEWSNIYPHSTPLISDDGLVMVYLDDMESKNVEDTTVNYSLLDGTTNTYNQGKVVSDNGYGDVQLSIDGDKDNLVAAFVRQSDITGKNEGALLSDEEVMQLMNLTEIYVSDYDSVNDSWNTIRLTDNAGADLSPVIATNGTKSVVAWREVAATDYSNPTEFDGLDRVVYSISDANGASWSAPKVLYDGTKGNVMSISADMLEDGTAAIVYSYDESEGVNKDMEVAAAIVKEDAGNNDELNGDNSVTIVNLTDDNALNENVQLTTAEIDGEENFVIAWFNQSIETKETPDADGIMQSIDYEIPEIKIMALDANASVNGKLPGVLSQITANSGVEVGNEFIFSQNSSDITDLALAWVDISESGSVVTNADTNVTEEITPSTYTINSAKFIENGNEIGLSAVSEIAEMPENVSPTHFDLYRTGTDSYNAVILGTDYGTNILHSKQTTLETTDENGNPITEILEVPTALTLTDMYSATLSFNNTIRSDEAYTDIEDVRANDDIDIGFTFTNMGKDAITDIELVIDNTVVKTFKDLNVAPGQTADLYANYLLGNTIGNVDYTLNATFENGDKASDSSTIYIQYPDIGISKFEIIKEEDGVRDMNFVLFNGLEIPLEGSGKTVKVALYSSPEYTPESIITSVPEMVISSDAQLALIDKGAYSGSMSLDMNTLLAEVNKDEDGNEVPDPLTELPTGGIEVYAKAWIETTYENELVEQAEVYLNDNFATVTAMSLLEKNDNEPVTITEELTHETTTTAEITLLNNSLTEIQTGNLLVQLVDAEGNVIESMQTYDEAAADKGFITLGGEKSTTMSFAFTKKGADVIVSYGEVVQAVPSTEISSISIQGIPLAVENFDADNNASVTVQTVTDENATFTIMAKSKTAEIAIVEGATADTNTDADIYAGKADLGGIENTIVFTVSDDGKTETYTVKVSNTQGKATYTLNVEDSEENANANGSGLQREGSTVTIHAGDREDYTFAGWTTSNSDVVFTDANSPTTTMVMPSANVTVKATWTKDLTVNAPVTLDGFTVSEILVDEAIKEIPNKTMNKAASEVYDEAKKQGTTPKILITVLPETGLSGTEITFDPMTLGDIINEGLVLEVASDIGSTTYDNKALERILDQAEGELVTIIIRPASVLTEDQKETIGSRVAYELLVKVGDRFITDFRTGTVAVELMYALKEGEKAEDVQVMLVAENGKTTDKKATYSESEKMAKFSTDTYSIYMINVLNSEDSTDPTIPQTGDTSSIILVMLMFVLSAVSAVVVNKKRKKLN